MRLLSKIGIALLVFSSLFQTTIANSKNEVALKNAIKLFNEKKITQAKKIFTSITQKKTDNPIANYYLGRIFLSQKDYKNSIKCLGKAIKMDKNNSRYHFFLGQAYGLKAQKVNIFKKLYAAGMVKKEFEKAVELDPESIEARFALRQFYLRAPSLMGGDKNKAKKQAAEIKKIKQMRKNKALKLTDS